MSNLTDKELAALRPNMRLDRASETILRRDLIALLDEVGRHRATMQRLEDMMHRLDWGGEFSRPVAAELRDLIRRAP